jgi:hypothetical protein
MAIIPIIDAPDTPSPIATPTLEEVAVGATANDGTGDTIRAAWTKSNENFGMMLGALQAAAPQAWDVTSVQTADYTATTGSVVIRMNTTAGDLDVILPAAADVEGHCLEIVKWDNSSNDVICVLDGTDVFYGTTGTLTSQYEVLRLRSVGTGWLKV